MWIFVALTAHSLFSVVALLDKYIVEKAILKPQLYAFFVGMLGAGALVLVPFGVVEAPAIPDMALALAAGAVRLFAVFALFSALKRFEVSRVVPAIGGMTPSLTLLATLLLGKGEGLLSQDLLAFLLLVAGSIGVSIEKGTFTTMRSLRISFVAALLFSLHFLLSKFVYEAQPFWSGFFWIMIGGLLAAPAFLFSKEVRVGIAGMAGGVKREKALPMKTGLLLVSKETIAGTAFILQSWAIALVPFGYLAFVHALEGIKYVLLLGFAVLLSRVFPSVLREVVSKGLMTQKLISISFIIGGLALLALRSGI